MSNRCNDCNKFVGIELSSNVDVGSADCDEDGNCTADQIRVVGECAECGCELRESELEVSVTLDAVAAHFAEVKAAAEASAATRAAEVEAAKARGEEPSEDDGDEEAHEIVECEFDAEGEEGEEKERGKRPRRTFGVWGTFTVKCSCGKEFESETLRNDVAVADMEPCG